MVEARRASPSTGSVVIVNSSPARASSTPPRSNAPSRIFGPCRSASTPTARPRGVGGRAHARDRRAACSSCVPCEKLRRATSMPASISSRIASGVDVAGPSVQTILARRVIVPTMPRYSGGTGKRMGWMTGFEPATLEPQSSALPAELHPPPPDRAKPAAWHVARLEGIEPPTDGLEIRCSIRLSYRRGVLGSTPGVPPGQRSGREDLNLRHPAPKAGALPGCATPRWFQPRSPVRIAAARSGRQSARAAAAPARPLRRVGRAPMLAGVHLSRPQSGPPRRGPHRIERSRGT